VSPGWYLYSLIGRCSSPALKMGYHGASMWEMSHQNNTIRNMTSATHAECNMIYSTKKDTATGEMITYAVRRLLLFTKMIWVSIVTGMALVSLHDRCDG
jgi:hypothetical protein